MARKSRAAQAQLEVFDPGVWYPAAEIQARLSVSRDTVERWGSTGQVQALRIGRKSVRYLGADLNRMLTRLGPGEL